jgi:hypothetical protein
MFDGVTFRQVAPQLVPTQNAAVETEGAPSPTAFLARATQR